MLFCDLACVRVSSPFCGPPVCFSVFVSFTAFGSRCSSLSRFPYIIQWEEPRKREHSMTMSTTFLSNFRSPLRGSLDRGFCDSKEWSALPSDPDDIFPVSVFGFGFSFPSPSPWALYRPPVQALDISLYPICFYAVLSNTF